MKIKEFITERGYMVYFLFKPPIMWIEKKFEIYGKPSMLVTAFGFMTIVSLFPNLRFVFQPYFAKDNYALWLFLAGWLVFYVDKYVNKEHGEIWKVHYRKWQEGKK